MTKLLKLALCSILAVSLVACSGESNNEVACNEPEVSIGLVTDLGGIDDKSFNQSAWEGLEKFASENGYSTEPGCEINFLQSDAEADYIPNLTTLADNGNDLVIAVGYLFAEAVATTAPNYPDTNFLFIDEISDQPNVMNAVFAAEQGSYLVGVAAGLKSIENGSNTVGFIGGMEGPLIGTFQAGYEQGVLAANPDATIIVDYADSFGDPAKGQTLAAKQYDAGATVIYQAAGASGNGTIKEARERKDVWVIGVDKDQYAEGEYEGGNVMLTSMVKRVDTASYTAAKAIKDGTFTGGTITFDLKNEGVSAELSTGRNLDDNTIEVINSYKDKIINGEISVATVPTIANGKTNK